MKLIADNWLLIAVLLLAFTVRAAGIGWGFPLTLNNDESAVVRSALGMRFGDLNPHFFDWPSLYRYLNFFLFMTFIKFRVPFQLLFGVETMRRILPFWWDSDPLPFYFLARLMTAILGTATVYVIYRIGRRFLDLKISLLAALFLAVNYYHVINSQIATLDVAMTFFFALSCYFALRIFEKGMLRDYLLAGLFLGLATSTKYNAGLGVLPILAAHTLFSFNNNPHALPKRGPFGHLVGNLWKLLLLGLAALGGFLLGTPYAILDWKTFWRADDIHGFLWTFKRTAPAANWLWLVERVFFGGWGLPLGLLIILGYVLRARKFFKEKDRLSLVLLSFPIPYFLYLGSWAKPRSQYMLPMLLFEAIFGAEAFFFLRRFLKKPFLEAVFLIILLLSPLYKIARLDWQKLIENDTRTQATEWIAENIPWDSVLAGAGTIAGDYGGELPKIRMINEENPEQGYVYKGVGGVAVDSFDALLLREALKEWQVEYVLLSSRIKGAHLFEVWVRENAVSVQTFEPVWSAVSPRIEICKIDYENL